MSGNLGDIKWSQYRKDSTFLFTASSSWESEQGSLEAPWRKHIPDIQRNGHNGVENDDIGPEGEEAREEGTVHRLIPGQVDLEARPNFVLPDGITNGQDHTHANQESKNLRRDESRRGGGA